MVDNGGNANDFRSPILVEPNIISSQAITAGGGSSDLLRTPYAGNVRSLPPPLPQSPYGATSGNYAINSGYGGYTGYNSMGNAFGSYGGYGNGLSSYGGFGGYTGGYGNGFGSGYNRFGMGSVNPMDPEARFIQMAENSSRPAFQSIESLVSAIGNIAAMLDSTFFALTSSFRAILGVAANFGRLRGVFSQFWQTFAIFRALTWIYKKILYWLHLSHMDPSSEKFKQAFAEAVNDSSEQTGAPKLPRKGQSPWPVLAFLSFIFTAPYLIMRLLGTVTNTAQEEARNPAKWVNPIATFAMYDFQARNTSELTIQCNEPLIIAPKEIQNTLGMLNTGWAMASSVDRQNVGIIPINYVKSPQQLRDEQQLQQQHMTSDAIQPVPKIVSEPQPALMDLSTSAFAAPPADRQQSNAVDKQVFDNASQPRGTSITAMLAASENCEV